MTDKDIIDGILQHEGSAYTNVPGDRGGPTRYGITLKTLAAWRKVPVLPTDVQLLTEEEARAIYADLYIKRPRYDLIKDDLLRALVVDCGVNSGVRAATSWLQQALGVVTDGSIGPTTLATLDAIPPAAVYLRLCAIRVRFYGTIISHDPSQAAFAAGWANRVAQFIEQAHGAQIT